MSCGPMWPSTPPSARSSRKGENKTEQLIDLYRACEDAGYAVDYFTMTLAESLSICLPGGECCIALNPHALTSVAKEKALLFHEKGHCDTLSFYSEDTPAEEKARCEVRASRSAWRDALPWNALCRAVRSGCGSIYELSEYFNLPEDFVRGAVDYYTGPMGLKFDGMARRA